MASETTPPTGATRYLQTTRGLLSYSQLAPLLAERVLHVEQSILAGQFAVKNFDPEFFLSFHRAIAGDLCPDWAGRWRTAEVRVGEHNPPPPYRVPMLMHDYCEDLRVRLANVAGEDNATLELLAFGEGRLLSIHPFTDFNGRVTRLFLRELLRRLQLPFVDLTPLNDEQSAIYRSALRAGDKLDWQLLMDVWKWRFESFDKAGPT